MLTLRTKLALAVLNDIQYKDCQLSTSFNYSPSEIAYLLQALSNGHLIMLAENQLKYQGLLTSISQEFTNLQTVMK